MTMFQSKLLDFKPSLDSPISIIVMGNMLCITKAATPSGNLS